MHDLDRTMQELEFDQEYDAFEFDNSMEFNDEYDEHEYGEHEYDEHEYDGEYADETGDYEWESDYEGDLEGDFESGRLFSEEEELELATELLNVSSDAELDQFLGRFFKRAGRRLRKFGRGLKRVGRKAFKVVKGIAKRALPIAGGVVGGMFGGPIGSKLGGMAGKAAGGIFELELEGMSPEDQEFEVARRMVRFAGAATKNAARLGQKIPPQKAIRMGFTAAAKRHAPGLLKPRVRQSAGNRGNNGSIIRSGRWIMRGDNKIVLYGL